MPDPVTVAAGIGALGNLVGGFLGSSAQKKANKAMLKEGKRNRKWLKMMSDTEWQRGVEDMKAAGLNPMLALSQGGASTPGSSAVSQIPEDALARGVSSAGDKAALAVQLSNVIANTEKTMQEARGAKNQADISGVQADIAKAGSATRIHTAEAMANMEMERMRQELDNMAEQGMLTRRQAQQIQMLMPEIHKQAQSQSEIMKYGISSAKAEAEFYDSLGPMGTGASRDIIRTIIQMLRN